MLLFLTIYILQNSKKFWKKKLKMIQKWVGQYSFDDGFGITKGSKADVEYWISTFNSLVESIRIDKFTCGSRVDYMDLTIFKGNRFYQKSLFEIKSFRKKKSLRLHPTKKQSQKTHHNFFLWSLSWKDKSNTILKNCVSWNCEINFSTD